MTTEEYYVLTSAADGKLQYIQYVAAKDGDRFRVKYERLTNREGLKVLHCAAAAGQTDVCKFFIEDIKMNINIITEKGETPLFLAMKGGHLATATYIIQHGADISVRDSEGKTPLHYAAERGQEKLVQLLILHGADIEAFHFYGTPIQVAASYGKKEALGVLLEHKANPNPTSPLPVTPVMLSIIAHSIECLDMLLKAGADPNVSGAGMTPLACAALEVETQYMKLLLKAGADPNVIDSTGMTPIEHAAMACNDAAVTILFPVTCCIPSIPDWSIHGIMSFIRSHEGMKDRDPKRMEAFETSKRSGEDAIQRRDYLNAACCYSEAHYLNPNDALVVSYRSLCWENLNNGHLALRDAEICVHLRPDWPTAHYREGVAWNLLKNYSMAAKVFSRALRLDPESKEIRKALREARDDEIGVPEAFRVQRRRRRT